MKIIAEIGSVHDGSFGNALALIDLAARCGANVVKFQTHIADAETLHNAPMPHYFQGEPRKEYFERTAFTLEQWLKIAAHSAAAGVEFLSSPFSLEAVDLLEDVGVQSYKIPSGEVSNTPLLERIASTRKPVYLSSGMSNWQELDRAIDILKGVCDLTIMQCSSLYPCPAESVGLNVMVEMRDRYKLPIGFSDHTIGSAACISAVALGATVVEKHFTFSRWMYGSDAKHSMEPADFKILCEELVFARKIYLSHVDKNELQIYREMKLIFEKSIVSNLSMKAGEIITINSLAFKKPGDGIKASSYRDLLGKKITRDISKDHKFTWGDFL